ncbi:MAG: TonB-dependent receptor [Planctomycetes bacterium]|nr:TonB-dependent receptor [Planctomycetota bacterium]
MAGPLIFAFCLLAAPQATAAEPAKKGSLASEFARMSLDQLMNVEVDTVYAASRHKQKLADAPAYVTIVTAEDIRRFGYRTLADILRSVPGFYTTYDRNYHHLGIRGFNRPGDYDTRVLLLVDGHRLNDNIYDCPPIGTQGIVDAGIIERVEVIRGPGSALYGSNALLGVINVVTRRGRAIGGAELAAEAASFGSYRGRLTFGQAFADNCEIFFSASAYDSAGPRRLYYKEYDDPATNRGIARSCDDDRYGNLFATLSFGEFTLQAAYVSREKGIPTGAFDTRFNDPRTRTVDARGYLDLKWQHDLSDHTNLMARLYYDYSGYRGSYAYDDGPGVLMTKESSRDQWWGAELVFTHTFGSPLPATGAPPLGPHRLTWGVEYRDNFQQDLHGRHTEVYLHTHNRSRIWAAFIQDEVRILHNLALVAGVRHDHYSTFGGSTNPRLSLIWQPFEATTLKALYGRAFRAPNAYEMYYNDDGATQKGNPDLKPETIDTAELVLEQRLSEHLRLTAAAFAYRMKDIITLEEDPSDGLMVFQNGRRARAKGLEAELAGAWPCGLRARASYSLARAEDGETGQRLVNSPTHLAKLNVSVPVVRDKLFASLELQYTSRRDTLAGRHAGAFWLANFTLHGRDLLKGLDASLGVYNLFDRRYRDPGSREHRQDAIEQDGRTFRLQIIKRF